MTEEESLHTDIKDLERQIAELHKKRSLYSKDFKKFAHTHKKEYIYFLICLFSGMLLILISLFCIVLYPKIVYNNMTFDTTLWSALLTIGIATAGISFILFQLNKTKKDTIRLYILQKQIDEVAILESNLKKMQQAYSMALALSVSNIVKPEQLENYSKMGAVALKYDNIHPDAFIKFLKDKLKKSKSMSTEERKKIKIAIEGFTILKKNILVLNRNPTEEEKIKQQKIADDLNKNGLN
jgi:hypothetical protein